MKILISGDMTITPISRSLGKTLKDLQIIESDFNSWLLQSIDENSAFHKESPEYWIQIWSPRAVTDNLYIVDQVRTFLSGLEKTNHKTQIIVTSFVVDPVMPQPIHLSFQHQKIADELNLMLSEFSRANHFFKVLNLQSLFTLHGTKVLTDSRYEALGRMYFSPNGTNLLVPFLARGLNALRNIPKKVLVLDLDNTMWGGILGEDGIDGIKIGGEGKGYLFTRFQLALKALKENGILLALCSKNNEEEVLKVFRDHPDMVIRLNDIAAYRINWEPKAVNLQELALELNLGLSSFVFFDDSAFERENIRQMTPEVAVIETPEDPADYILALNQFTGFDVFKVTDEDKKRSSQYQEEAKRSSLKKSSSSLEDFYRSLEMKATLSLADESSFDRVHQLIWKTNQFNLTTKRYEESELKSILGDKNYEVILLRLQDKMGESGITGVVILKKESKVWEIENLMLSCRIIGRTVEFALIKRIAERAKKSGVHKLKATFVPSEKNIVAAKFLQQAGLTQLQSGAVELWELNLLDLSKIPSDYITMNDDINGSPND